MNVLINKIKKWWWCENNKYLVTKIVKYFKENGYTPEQTALENEYPLFIVKNIWRKI